MFLSLGIILLINNMNFLIRKRLFLSNISVRKYSENVVSFKNVSYEYVYEKPILKEVNFSIRKGSKVTIMGQNGSGKSTIIKLLSGSLKPENGEINRSSISAISTCLQVMPREYSNLSVKDFFKLQLQGNESGLGSRIVSALQKVKFDAPLDRIIKSFSGGQQSRLLLAAALIVEPDIILLDEPTNNLDKNGIHHLTSFIQECEQTCVVISHDEEFLNEFSDTVLYLDVFSKKVEQYDGNYLDVKREITARIARENSENVRLMKAAQEKKDQANKFANKGGGMRKAALKMREQAEEMESEIVDVRKEDKALGAFEIPLQVDAKLGGILLEISSISLPNIRNGAPRPLQLGPMAFRKGDRVRIVGPNGIGKTTLLEMIMACHGGNKATGGIETNKAAKIGYYRQDFSTLDFDETVLESLRSASDGKHSEQEIRKIGAKFFLSSELVKQRIATLSEGQKGLLSLARLLLLQPAVLLLDEPTNHINFRHLPAIAKALNAFKGVLLLVSHDDDFVRKVKMDQELDLAYEAAGAQR